MVEKGKNMKPSAKPVPEEGITELELRLRKIESDKAELEGKIKLLKDEERKKVLAELKAQVKKYLFSSKDIFGSASVPSEPKSPAIPKVKTTPSEEAAYINEEGKTWGGGRGRKPDWVKKVEASGADIEQYRVKKDKQVST